MKRYVTRVSAQTLLALGGSFIFLVFGLGLLSHVLHPEWYRADTPRHLRGESAFTIGQYYFNHDDDPAPPYDLTKAQYFYELEISKNPTGNNLVWYQSGRVDFINGDFNKALVKFATQLEYFGDSIPNVYYMVGLTYGFKARQTDDPEDWKKAEEGFKKSIEYFKTAPWPYVDLAWIYFSQGKYESMKDLLETALSSDSNNPWLLNMYGLALLNTGNTALSHEYFLFAEEEANKLSVADWGSTYPGNDPLLWNRGLQEFQMLIKQNVALTSKTN